MDNYELLFSDDYAYESYDSLFDDSYSYDYAMEATDENNKKPGFIKNLIDKFKSFLSNFLRELKDFLFGSKDKVKPGILGYIKGLWRAALADSNAKLKASGSSQFIAMESGEPNPYQKITTNDREYWRFDKNSVNSDRTVNKNYKANAAALEKKIQEIAKSAKDAGDENCYKFLLNASSSMMARVNDKDHDTDDEAVSKTILNTMTSYTSASLANATKIGKSIESEPTEKIEGFKSFIGTLVRFFKYSFKLISLSVVRNKAVSASKQMNTATYVGQEKNGNKYYKLNFVPNRWVKEIPKGESDFLGRIAEESYNEGYADALFELKNSAFEGFLPTQEEKDARAEAKRLFKEAGPITKAIQKETDPKKKKALWNKAIAFIKKSYVALPEKDKAKKKKAYDDIIASWSYFRDNPDAKAHKSIFNTITKKSK